MQHSPGRASFAAALFAGLLPLAAQEPVNRTPIALPDYNVYAARDLPPPEEWRYTQIESFEVLSSASETATRGLADGLRRFAYALNLVWPGMRPALAAPGVIVVCGETGQFGRFLPAAADRATPPLVVRLRGPELTALVVDERTKVLESDDPAAGEGGVGRDTGRRVDTGEVVREAYVDLILSGLQPRLPPWLEAGLRGLCLDLRMTDREISVGRIENPAAAPADAAALAEMAAGVGGGAGGATMVLPPAAYRIDDTGFSRALAARALLPINELLGRERPEDDRAGDARLWAKQCYALVHWGLYGDLGKNQRAFLRLVGAALAGPVDDAKFKEAVGLDPDAMLLALRTHIEFTRAKVAGLRVDRGETIPWPAPIEVRAATEGEIGRLKARVLAAAGRPAEARAAAVDAYRRGARDPDLLAALGLAELAAGEAERARRFLEGAFAGGTTDPRADVELARLRLAEQRAKAGGPDAHLAPAALAAVLEPLFAARRQPPPLADTYRLVAEAWSASATPPEPAHLAVLDEGLRLFPADPTLRAARARWPAAK
jgi:hypothetical protein